MPPADGSSLIRAERPGARSFFLPGTVALATSATSVALVPGLQGLFGALLALLMIAIAVSDARSFIIPNQFTAAAFVLAVVQTALLDADTFSALGWLMLRAVATAALLLLVMTAYQFARRQRGLGLGDVKLAAVAGAWLDWFTIIAVIETATIAALGVYLIRSYVSNRPIEATAAVPFGLYFAPTIWLGWLIERIFIDQALERFSLALP